ncbi:reaper [Cochliomyia hominivorax]
MAVAFYIPDQAAMLRKAQQQEQQILAMREAHWRYVASVVYDALKQYLEVTPSILQRSKNNKKCKTDKN